MTKKIVAAEPEAVYADALRTLTESGVPFLVGGRMRWVHMPISIATPKISMSFCRTGDCPRLLTALESAGFQPELTDANWLAKAFKGENYVDLIFSSGNGLAPVDDLWFEHCRDAEVCGRNVKLAPPEEIIWSKSTVQSRYRYDGADVQHIIRMEGRNLDWRRLLSRMEPIWEILLAYLMLFRFVYPSERDAVPQWLMQELSIAPMRNYAYRSRTSASAVAPCSRETSTCQTFWSGGTSKPERKPPT